MKKVFIALGTLFLSFSSFGQTLYAPGGAVQSSSTANVGIGIPNPFSAFHIYSTGGTVPYIQQTIQSTVSSAGLKLINNTNYGWEIQNVKDDNSFIIYDRTAGAYRFLIGSNGNTFIGSSSMTPVTPSSRLQVMATNITALEVFSAHSSNYGYAALIKVNRSCTKALCIYNLSSNEPVFNIMGNGLVNAKTILAEQVQVRSDAMAAGWCDYVFKDDYKLTTLSELEKFIKNNNHLPDVPSENEVKENGIDLASMDAVLLKKIEELTLYTINQQKEIELLKQQIEVLSNK